MRENGVYLYECQVYSCLSFYTGDCKDRNDPIAITNVPQTALMVSYKDNYPKTGNFKKNFLNNF